jgi:hypothetical protein
MSQRRKLRVLDTVALIEILPDRNLKQREVGTVVEIVAPIFSR